MSYSTRSFSLGRRSYRHGGGIARIAALALSAIAVSSAHADTVNLSVLWAFTGELGIGATPFAPPFFDTGSGRLFGSTGRAGQTAFSGVVYTFDPNDPADSYRAANAGSSATGVYAPGVVAGSVGVYGGLTSSGFFSIDAATLAPSAIALSGVACAGTNYGLWAMSGNNIYLHKICSDNAYLLQYATDTGEAKVLKDWPASMTPELLFHAAPTTVVAGEDGWLYGVMDSYYRHPFSPVPEQEAKPFVYRIKADGSEYEELAEFSDALGAGYPLVNTGEAAYSSLAEGADGWLYGTTYGMEPGQINAGRALPNDSLGTVYRVSKTETDAATGRKKFEVLHTFAGAEEDGQAAYGRLVQAADGNVYGTTRAGGAHGHGTLWRIVLAEGAAPVYELLHSFKEDVDGRVPVGLTLGDDGWTLYGAAQIGGTHNQGVNTSGTVFKVEIPRPSVTLDTFTVDGADTASIDDGAKVTLAWSSTNATACTAGGDWSGAKQASGEEQTGALAHREAAYTFTLACNDDFGGKSESKSVTVTVAAPPEPEPEPEPTPESGEDDDSGGSGGSLPLGLVLLAPVALLAARRRHVGGAE